MKKLFKCSTCGARFEDHEINQKVWDQDEGYGNCESCAKWLSDRREQEWTGLESRFRERLNEANRAKFDAMEMEVRRGLLLEAIEDGLITYEIRRGPSVSVMSLIEKQG